MDDQKSRSGDIGEILRVLMEILAAVLFAADDAMFGNFIAFSP
jgi:hypothetical protein